MLAPIAAVALVLGLIVPITIHAEIISVAARGPTRPGGLAPAPDGAARISAEHSQPGPDLPTRIHSFPGLRLRLCRAERRRLLRGLAKLRLLAGLRFRLSLWRFPGFGFGAGRFIDLPGFMVATDSTIGQVFHGAAKVNTRSAGSAHVGGFGRR